MKLLCVFFFLPFVSMGQSLVAASPEAVQYEKIQRALDSDDPRAAIDAFDELLTATRETSEDAQLIEQHFGMALALALNGNYRESIRFHKKALRLHKNINDEDATEIRINLGLTYQLAGRTKKARRILGTLFPGDSGGDSQL